MLGFLDAPSQPPNRVTDKKDKEYHSKYARYATSNSYSQTYADWLKKFSINKRYYAGKQWENNEDLETFLKDVDGNTRNRIQVVFNTIRPLVEQYRGNGNILRLGATCKSSSPLSITRKEQALAEALFRFEVAEQSDSFRDAMNDPNIGETEEETTEIFENTYTDEYAESMNSLLRYSSLRNDFKGKQIITAKDMALSGLAVMEGFEYNQHLCFDRVDPSEFFWDTSAKLPDLSDSSFMGRAYMAMPTEIYEQYQVSEKDKKKIETFITNNSSSVNTYNSEIDNLNRRNGYSENRIPVYRVYWRDTDVYEFGYVQSEFDDYKVLVRLDATDEDGNLKYKESDLVEPPQNKIGKKYFKGKKKARLTVDTLRYCVFTPADVIASGQSDAVKSKEKVEDIVYDYGVFEHQEVTQEDWRSVKFPFKCYTWGYVDGEVLSPVDDAISPQRFINRVLSVAENQINNSAGSNIIVDKASIDPQDGEEGVMRNINNGRVLTMNSRGLGIPNTVGTYDATPKAGTYALFDIIPTMKGIIDQTTGVNEALRGESMGSDQLVGVTNSLIQRGSLMQEPFYHGISKLFEQCYEMVATVGRDIYIDNEASLHMAVGDDAAYAIKLSKDMKNEDFRIFIERAQDDDSQRATADQMLMLFMEAGLLDQKDFANLYNRSTPDQVTKALRETAKARIEMERAEAKAAEESEAATLQAMQQQQAVDESKQFEQGRLKHQDKLEEIYAKEDAKLGASNPSMPS